MKIRPYKIFKHNSFSERISEFTEDKLTIIYFIYEIKYTFESSFNPYYLHWDDNIKMNYIHIDDDYGDNSDCSDTSDSNDSCNNSDLSNISDSILKPQLQYNQQIEHQITSEMTKIWDEEIQYKKKKLLKRMRLFSK